MSDDVRGDIDKAVSSLADKGGAPAATSAPAAAPTEPPKPPETTPAGGDGAGAAPAGGAPAAGGGEPPKPPTAAPTGGTAPAATSPVDAGAAAAAAALKAPATWKPAVREFWEKLDPLVREEVLRRESEIARALTETGDARRFHREMSETLTPFNHLLTLGGLTPSQNIKALLSTVNNLRLGSPAQRSEILAQLVMDYGADLPALDSALARRLGKGGAPRGGGNGGGAGTDIDAAIQRHLSPLIAPLQEFAKGREATQKQEDARIEAELQAFVADPKNEFVNDVLQEMADLMGVYSGRGVKLSLQDAYQKAIMLHPDISKILSQRQIDAAAKKKAEEAAAALQAGASVSSSTGAASLPAAGDGADLRKTLEAAFDAHSRASR